MTGTDTDTKKRGGPRACFYVDADNLIKRIIGQPDDIGLLANVNADIAKRLEVEGYIVLHSRGFSHDDIVSGKALPERALPGVKVAKTPKVAKVARKPNAKLRAIAAVLGKEYGEPQRAAGEKETRKENYDRALVVVKTFTKEEVAALMKHEDVMAVYAGIIGIKGSIDDIRKAAKPIDQTEADEATEATETAEPPVTQESEQHAQAAD